MTSPSRTFLLIAFGFSWSVAVALWVLGGFALPSVRLCGVLLVVGVVAAGVTPLALYARHVARTVWGSTVKAIGFVVKLRTATLLGLATYGSVLLGSRFAERAPVSIAL